ncbi:MAG: hypothetical protein V2A79_03190 [Planctomycetota bacterium]
MLCGRIDLGAHEGGLADSDCDRVVDFQEYALWKACETGPGNGPYAEGCDVFARDLDGDLDFFDFAAFQELFTGP